ncbi:MAG TPA: PadR family transcriptional regulator [Opitutaceae bacterium]|nr:PadR family transcriptional regulator [Opitutaceae bacterium]
MPRIQRTPFVILGLLGLSDREPRSGYEIKKAIDSVISHVWSESHGQLYPVLKRLTAEKLVRAQDRKDGRRKKVVYTITAKGRERLRAWLDRPVEFSRPRDELILKLFFGSETEAAVLIRHLEHQRDRAKAGLGQLHHWQRENEAHPERYSPFLLITIRAGIAMSEATLRWAEESIGTLSKLSPAAAK